MKNVTKQGKEMSDTMLQHDSIKIILMNLQSIDEKVKEVNEEILAVKKEIIKYENQFNKCILHFDDRYVKKDNFTMVFANELEAHKDKIMSRATQKVDYVKSIMQVVMILAPYIVLIAGFINMSKG